MTEIQFLSMVSGYALYYGPMMDTWRIVFLAVCIIGGLVLGTALMIQRGLSAYL